MSPRLGYVVKRFPRASETFIAQEILELERRGAEVQILTLWPNDVSARHGWLDQLAAPITHCGDLPLSDAWKALHRRSQDPSTGERARLALDQAFQYPDRRGRHRLREAVAVAEAAERLGLEHLHAHFANDPAFVAYLAHLAGGLPFSFTAHAKDIYAKALPPATLRRVVAAAAFAVTVSEDNRRHLAAAVGPRLAPKVLRLYNGVDLAAVRPRTAPSAGEPFGIVCVARLVEKKGVEHLLEALAVLARRGIRHRCTLIGSGPLRARLRERTARLGLEGSVRFTGTLVHEAVIEALRTHDVLVLPACVARDGDRDALPTVLLEAMAAGMPCVSTPVGGIPEIIVHRRTGLVLPTAEPLALANALAELAAKPDLRQSLGAAARIRAESLFDRRTNVARLHAWFSHSANGRQVIDSPPELRAVEAG